MIHSLDQFAYNLDYCKRFRKVYNYQKRYCVWTHIIPRSNSAQKYLVRFEDNRSKKTHNKTVCAAEDVFDAIHNAQQAVGHKHVATTKNKVNEVYYNITENQIKIFIKLCPVCAQVNDNTSKQKRSWYCYQICWVL